MNIGPFLNCVRSITHSFHGLSMPTFDFRRDSVTFILISSSCHYGFGCGKQDIENDRDDVVKLECFGPYWGYYLLKLPCMGVNTSSMARIRTVLTYIK